MTRALFPGSFDPFHNGHLEVVERARRLFDEVIVAVLNNPQKGEPLFSAGEREQMVAECLGQYDNVEIVSMTTLVVEVARPGPRRRDREGALRVVTDFENELQMAQMNQQLSGVETLMLPTGSAYSFISSRLVREVARYGGDVSAFVPDPIAVRMKERFGA